MKEFDLIVVGAGPGGSTCAALCVENGGKVLILEACKFPRDKVCGDCLNPTVWPILEQLGLASAVRSLPSTTPAAMRFSVSGHREVEIPTTAPSDEHSYHEERVVRRRDFDALLAARAVELGAVLKDGTPVTGLRHDSGIWEVRVASGQIFRAPRVVAADGRNSVIARHRRFYASEAIDRRIGMQTHLPHPVGYDGTLSMRFYRHGYGGIADLGGGLANLCLVANKNSMKELRREVEDHFGIHDRVVWRSITPIARAQAKEPARDGIYLCGDAARVVEPFTGEGISYALRSGALLARILSESNGLKTPPSRHQDEIYRLAHGKLYGESIWINRLTRFLSEHPGVAQSLGPLLLKYPALLGFLTKKVLNNQTRGSKCRESH